MNNWIAAQIVLIFGRRAVSCSDAKIIALAQPQVPNPAPQIRIAFSNMALNTGSSSPGDELMTRNTSAVAVCCSSDCRNSLSSRVFSMAMTAWAAKFATSAICLSVNGWTSWR